MGDPIARLRDHLIALGEWDMERHSAQDKALGDQVRLANKAAEANGVLGDGLTNQPLETMFEGVFEHKPWHLAEQEAQMLAEWKAAGLPVVLAHNAELHP